MAAFTMSTSSPSTIASDGAGSWPSRRANSPSSSGGTSFSVFGCPPKARHGGGGGSRSASRSPAGSGWPVPRYIPQVEASSGRSFRFIGDIPLESRDMRELVEIHGTYRSVPEDHQLLDDIRVFVLVI